MGLKSSPALSIINGGLLETNFSFSISLSLSLFISLLRKAIKTKTLKLFKHSFV